MAPTRLLTWLALLAGAPLTLAAQAPDSARATSHPIRAWQVGAALGGIAVVSLADRSLRDYVLDHRTSGEIDLATKWQKWGEGAIPAAITVGALGTGLILHKPAITRTGERLVTSFAVATVIGWGLKTSVSRYRPSETTDPYVFSPFGKHTAFPSGHTYSAFVVSTTLADAIHNRWVDAGLYTLAAGTGVSRVVGNHHWGSDVVAGGLLGLTVAKVVDGKWTIFGLHSPEFLTGPAGAGLRWTADIPALRGGAGPR